MVFQARVSQVVPMLGLLWHGKDLDVSGSYGLDPVWSGWAVRAS